MRNLLPYELYSINEEHSIKYPKELLYKIVEKYKYWCGLSEDEKKTEMIWVEYDMTDYIFDSFLIQLGRAICQLILYPNYDYEPSRSEINQDKNFYDIIKIEKELMEQIEISFKKKKLTKFISEKLERTMVNIVINDYEGYAFNREKNMGGGILPFWRTDKKKFSSFGFHPNVYSLLLYRTKFFKDQIVDVVEHELQHLIQWMNGFYLKVSEDFVNFFFHNKMSKCLKLGGSSVDNYFFYIFILIGINVEGKKTGLGKTRNKQLTLDKNIDLKIKKYIEYQLEDSEYKTWISTYSRDITRSFFEKYPGKKNLLSSNKHNFYDLSNQIVKNAIEYSKKESENVEKESYIFLEFIKHRKEAVADLIKTINKLLIEMANEK